jgi:hypothetical protein
LVSRQSCWAAARACLHACVRACVRACVPVRMCACAALSPSRADGSAWPRTQSCPHTQVLFDFKGPTLTVDLVPASCPVRRSEATSRNEIVFEECSPVELVISTTPCGLRPMCRVERTSCQDPTGERAPWNSLPYIVNGVHPPPPCPPKWPHCPRYGRPATRRPQTP